MYLKYWPGQSGRQDQQVSDRSRMGGSPSFCLFGSIYCFCILDFLGIQWAWGKEHYISYFIEDVRRFMLIYKSGSQRVDSGSNAAL